MDSIRGRSNLCGDISAENLIKAIKVKLDGDDLKDLCEKFLNLRFGYICEDILPLDEKFFRGLWNSSASLEIIIP